MINTLQFARELKARLGNEFDTTIYTSVVDGRAYMICTSRATGEELIMQLDNESSCLRDHEAA